jgi:hypothetical protein
LRSDLDAVHLLCAGDRAGGNVGTRASARAGAGAGAGARAGTLDGEGTEVVDLTTLLDLESVVVAVGKRGRGSPDELAVLRIAGQGLDILEIVGDALAQEDGHGLCDVSALIAKPRKTRRYSQRKCRLSRM